MLLDAELEEFELLASRLQPDNSHIDIAKETKRKSRPIEIPHLHF